ncbi:glycoside hydrolase family 25 protein [uncultured Croceicoccus sp.]|uniref:glycoside hydrolase family 25 protein n=1 Tax=uncultured Croceicoccus sp. TaxID=1295329 RepID=UPI00262FDD3A|nr:glycoside hydrolase family 25 protein [uncultured Croceicoccus sp.]
MARHKSRRIWRMVALVVLVLALIGGAAAWWRASHWAPELSEYPSQGVWLGEAERDIRMEALPTLGARFAYVTASIGADGRNPAASGEMERALAAGLSVGAVHIFDPCRSADAQSANFVTLVPRASVLLPPAVVLRGNGEACEPRVRDAALEAELVTFLNQIEMHAGKRAILAPDEAFEAQYGFAARSQRPLWLARNWMMPEYGGRAWDYWTANDARETGPVDVPLRWIVAR